MPWRHISNCMVARESGPSALHPTPRPQRCRRTRSWRTRRAPASQKRRSQERHQSLPHRSFQVRHRYVSRNRRVILGTFFLTFTLLLSPTSHRRSCILMDTSAFPNAAFLPPSRWGLPDPSGLLDILCLFTRRIERTYGLLGHLRLGGICVDCPSFCDGTSVWHVCVCGGWEEE